jgi:nucleoside-diphosphate-sugar epimerase
MLREAGHEVTGTTRSEERAGLIRDLGAQPVVVDALDAEALVDAVGLAHPDAVIHQLTSIPKAVDPKRFAEQFAANNRLRREGTRNLVDAARAAEVPRLIAQSIAFAYAQKGGLHDEDDPLAVDSPGPFGDTVGALVDLEDAVTETGGINGLVLRYGYFYGPGTSFASDGAQSELVRRRRFPLVGKSEGVFSFIHIDDAAAATVRALDQGAPGIYNIVDDEPAAVSEWLPYLAEVLGAPAPRRVPLFLARMLGGTFGAQYVTRTEGATNEKAKRDLDLGLRYPSWRQGFREALG